MLKPVATIKYPSSRLHGLLASNRDPLAAAELGLGGFSSKRRMMGASGGGGGGKGDGGRNKAFGIAERLMEEDGVYVDTFRATDETEVGDFFNFCFFKKQTKKRKI